MTIEEAYKKSACEKNLQSMKHIPQNEMFKNIHQLTTSLGENKPMTIILTTNQGANTGDGGEEEDDEEQAPELNQS